MSATGSLALLAAIALSACGQKGPLKLPNSATTQAAPPAASAAAPIR